MHLVIHFLVTTSKTKGDAHLQLILEVGLTVHLVSGSMQTL